MTFDMRHTTGARTCRTTRSSGRFDGWQLSRLIRLRDGTGVSQLCADDQSNTMIHKFFASVFIDPKTLGERRRSSSSTVRNNFPAWTPSFTTDADATGLQLADPVLHRPSPQTVILDYSGGKFPLTQKWLQSYFGGTVGVATATSCYHRRTAWRPTVCQQQTLPVLVGRPLGHPTSSTPLIRWRIGFVGERAALCRPLGRACDARTHPHRVPGIQSGPARARPRQGRFPRPLYPVD